MDTTTHALTGLVLARAGLNKNTGKWGTIAALSAAVFPDLDLVLGIFGTEISLKYHRSLTNSIFLIIPISLVFAYLFIKMSKVRKFWDFFLIWVAVMSVHTFQDLMTSYGTMILSPFSDVRFSTDWIFIIDLYLSSALLLPLLASLRWKGKERILARFSLLLAALYVGLCAFNHSRALSLAESYAREKGIKPLAVAAIPQPLSPFYWGNFIVSEERIYQGLVNLRAWGDENPSEGENAVRRFMARYQPVSRLSYQDWPKLDRSPWVQKALQLEGVKEFFWFARFPLVRDLGWVEGRRRVEFFDLRFGSIGGRRLFLYVVDFDPHGRVAFHGFL